MTATLLSFAAADEPTIDFASTGFIIICASLVLLMTTPGLALFYGGMTRAKSVLNMMMMSYGAMGVVVAVVATFTLGLKHKIGRAHV